MVRMRRTVRFLALVVCLALGLSCCSGGSASAEDQDATGSGGGFAPLPVQQTQEEPGEETEMKLWIGETEVPVSWEENDSVEAIR